MKMKGVYQLTDELAIGSELQLQRWRQLSGLIEQYRQGPAGGNWPEASREQFQGLTEEIDEATRELAALRQEVKQVLHLKQFELHRLRSLRQTPSAARLESIWLEQAEVLHGLQRDWKGDQSWLESHLQEVGELLRGAAG